MQLIFERIVPYHSRGCIECSLSAFRKLKTPLAETTAQSRFSRRRFCLRVLSIKKKKKTFLDHVCRRIFHGYSRPPRSLSISKFNAWDKSAERATLLENFAIYWFRVYFFLSLLFWFSSCKKRKGKYHETNKYEFDKYYCNIPLSFWIFIN